MNIFLTRTHRLTSEGLD